MDLAVVVLSSAVVSAVVGSIAAYVSQRRLATHQAIVDYEFAARRRLYEALGPLRFQLLMAARDFNRRVKPHLENPGLMGNNEYRSTFVYRLLRPLALSELIQRQMAVVDFSVDEQARDLLKFEAASYRMLGTSHVLPYIAWSDQREHIRREPLRVAAAALIATDRDGGSSVIDYGTFESEHLLADPRLAVVVELFPSSVDTLAEMPVWWVRVVGFAHACGWIVNEQGANLGFNDGTLQVQEMIGHVDNQTILDHLDDYPTLFDGVLADKL